MPFVCLTKNNSNLSTVYIILWTFIIYLVETYMDSVCLVFTTLKKKKKIVHMHMNSSKLVSLYIYI